MNREFVMHMRAMTRLIYYVTEEEDRFLLQLQASLKEEQAKRTWVYNVAFGLVPLAQIIGDWQSGAHQVNEQALGIHDALIKIYQDNPLEDTNLYVIMDPERWFADPQVQRRVLNLAHHLHNNDRVVKIITFVGSRLSIPAKLQRYIEVVHDKGLSEKDCQKVLDEKCGKLEITPQPGLATLFRGLTSYEMDSAISQSVVATKRDSNALRIDPQIITDFKRQQLRKTDLLTYTDVTGITFDDLGGADNYKDWVTKTKSCWTPEGQNFGLKPPKGVLLVGVWGCGKSLGAKALANSWGLPMVSLEMGKLRSSAVGETEANIYRATSIIESVAPCVTGETEVTLADGSTRPIGDLWQDYQAGVLDSLRVQCWDERQLKATTTAVSAITARWAAVFRVEAAHGFALTATANHQHYVMRGGLPEWVRTDELIPGDMLAVPILKYEGDWDCKRFHSSDETSGGANTLPLTSHPDLGWLLGALRGNGQYYDAKSEISLSAHANHVKLLDAFERILFEQFGLKAARYPTNPDYPDHCPWVSSVTSPLAARFLQKMRASILTTPLEVRAAFVAGWLDGNGSVTPNNVAFAGDNYVDRPIPVPSAYRALARQVVQSLGVVPTVFDNRGMVITGSQATALAAVVGKYFVIQQAEVCAAGGADPKMGFACGALISEARRDSGVTHQVLQTHLSSSVTWGHENGRTTVSEQHLREYAKVFGSHTQAFDQLLEADCRWVRIESIHSAGDARVFDLVCEGQDTHSFFANGLVTHNCVVWLDEAEKGLAGAHSSSHSDAGTTSRVLGIFSTWLQETTAPICLVMTANSLKTLPVEFVNRMAERFFFDLPSTTERVAILKIHLKKQGQDPEALDKKEPRYQLAELAEAAKNMVGREIEQAVQAAMIDSFEQGHKFLSHKVLLKELSTKPRIYKTMVDELKEVLDWVGYDEEAGEGIRAKLASRSRSEVFKKFKVTTND